MFQYTGCFIETFSHQNISKNVKVMQFAVCTPSF